jgi:2-polyprenyl-3-methyl-5-hydroxy-6-metoxy-1,4-benzoquinol methylase
MSDTMVAGHFDSKAASWDVDASKHELAADIVRVVEREIGSKTRPRLLDYGAGTGLCSMALAPKCSSILAVDVSSGMLSRLEQKARAAEICHLKTLRHDLCNGPLDGMRFKVILCAMTLHHVRNTALLLRRFRSMLEPEGFLAIADLDKEDGSFHADPTGVEHKGFSRDHLVRQMMDAGFTLVSMETVHHIEKLGRSGPQRYPVFFTTGRMRIS